MLSGVAMNTDVPGSSLVIIKPILVVCRMCKDNSRMISDHHSCILSVKQGGSSTPIIDLHIQVGKLIEDVLMLKQETTSLKQEITCMKSDISTKLDHMFNNLMTEIKKTK